MRIQDMIPFLIALLLAFCNDIHGQMDEPIVWDLGHIYSDTTAWDAEIEKFRRKLSVESKSQLPINSAAQLLNVAETWDSLTLSARKIEL